MRVDNGHYPETALNGSVMPNFDEIGPWLGRAMPRTSRMAWGRSSAATLLTNSRQA